MGVDRVVLKIIQKGHHSTEELSQRAVTAPAATEMPAHGNRPSHAHSARLCRGRRPRGERTVFSADSTEAAGQPQSKTAS